MDSLQKTKDFGVCSTKSPELIAMRRAQLFDAASVVFTRRGYHSATMQEIADEAGLGKGTLYEYVKSKKDLLFLVVEEGHARLLSLIRELIGRDDPPEEKLDRAIRLQVAFINNYLDAAKTLMPEVEGLNVTDRERMESLKLEYLGEFRKIIDEGVEKGVFHDMAPLLASEVICNACMLWGKSEVIRERSLSPDDYENFLVSLFLKGIHT